MAICLKKESKFTAGECHLVWFSIENNIEISQNRNGNHILSQLYHYWVSDPKTQKH